METITIKDKDTHNYSVYQIVGAGLELEIKNDYENLRGIIINWSLDIDGTLYNGDSFEKLVNFLQKVIDNFGLKKYSEHKKDILVIYIDNLDKIRGFFEDYITQDFTHYVQVFNFIEFRDISNWQALHSAVEIYKYADFLIKNVFVPEEFFYLTPNQKVRKNIQKKAKAYGDTTAKDLFPEPSAFDTMRLGLYGGLCYCPYPNLVIKDPLIEIDIDSAYIFDFLIQKHVMSDLISVEPSNWEYYLTADNVTSIGWYKIKYSCYTNKCHCFKDIDDNRVEQGEGEADFIFNNIDLKIFLSLVDAKSVECKSLKVADLDYLPEYLRDQLIEEYVKKEELKKTKGSDDPETKLQKVCVNGIYGDSIRKFDESWDIKKAKNNAAMIPQWGIWTTSYCKAYLLGLALQLDGWYYSDTDSIYCKDTKQNRKIIDEYNEMIREETQEFCKLFGYEYEPLKDLGTFQIKDEIVKFKAITHKIYMYKTKNDDMVLKAAGSSKTTVILDESLFGLDKIPVGERTFGFIKNKSYFELSLEDKAAELMTEYIVKKNAKK